jgi:hypothetical protein
MAKDWAETALEFFAVMQRATMKENEIKQALENQTRDPAIVAEEAEIERWVRSQMLAAGFGPGRPN